MITKLITILFFVYTTFANGSVKELIADQSTLDSIIPGETNYYKFASLAPNSHYEIRISYPATSPADFHISFVDDATRIGRKLLNTEKIMFTTDSNGFIKGENPGLDSTHYLIQVTAKPSGVSPTNQNVAVSYNIVLETLFYGVPYDIFTIAVAVILGVIVIITVFIPQIFPFLVAVKSKSH